MLECKVFTHTSGKELDAAINAWLAARRREIISVTQSTGSNGMVTVTVIYDHSFPRG